MNLARVLEEGLGNLILNKLFKNEEQLNDFLETALEMKAGCGDLELMRESRKRKEFNFEFYLKDNKYELDIFCYMLVDEELIPYSCLVFERSE